MAGSYIGLHLFCIRRSVNGDLIYHSILTQPVVFCNVQVRREYPTATSSQTATQPPPLKKFKLLAQDVANRSASAFAATDVDGELSTYSTAVAQLNHSSAIDFWVANTAVMPNLAPIALNIISAPASQAYVERVFSVCGDLTTGKRNRMSKNLYMRVFLKMNSKYY